MENVEQQAEQFVSAHLAEVEPLMREEAIEEWESAATGDPEHDERVAQLRARLMRIYADEGRFARVRALHEATALANPLLARQVKQLL